MNYKSELKGITIIAAASEIIALTPLKSNSVIQIVLSAIEKIKPSKKI